MECELNGGNESSSSVKTMNTFGNESSVQMTECRLRKHEFTTQVFGEPIAFKILQMKDSLLIWIGSPAQNSLDNLSVAMPSRFGATPLSSQVLGDGTDSRSLSQKVAQKLSKHVTLSLSVPNPRAIPEIEKALFRDIKERPELY